MTELIKALIKARKNFKTVAFDKSGARNKYATLKSILSAVDEALMNEGILFTQSESFDEGVPVLETRLIHVSGESISSKAHIENDEKSPIGNANQRYGAALSYARRYSAMTILGLYADEADLDDYEHEERQMVNNSIKPVTDAQIKFIQTLIKQKGNPKMMHEIILRKYQIKSLEELQSKDASGAIKMLQANP